MVFFSEVENAIMTDYAAVFEGNIIPEMASFFEKYGWQSIIMQVVDLGYFTQPNANPIDSACFADLHDVFFTLSYLSEKSKAEANYKEQKSKE